MALKVLEQMHISCEFTVKLTNLANKMNKTKKKMKKKKKMMTKKTTKEVATVRMCVRASIATTR